MVSSLVDIDLTVASPARPEPPNRGDIACDRQLSCQIWPLTGTLIDKSDRAPEARLSDQRDGFSAREIDRETRRVFAVENAALGIQVLVGDDLDVRARLVREAMTGLLLPMALIVPALGALIWFGVGRGGGRSTSSPKACGTARQLTCIQSWQAQRLRRFGRSRPPSTACSSGCAKRATATRLPRLCRSRAAHAAGRTENPCR